VLVEVVVVDIIKIILKMDIVVVEVVEVGVIFMFLVILIL
jgi:hypothetical protein